MLDSIFELVDQRTRSITSEECAAFLDLLLDAVASGCPPTLRPLRSIQRLTGMRNLVQTILKAAPQIVRTLARARTRPHTLAHTFAHAFAHAS